LLKLKPLLSAIIQAKPEKEHISFCGEPIYPSNDGLPYKVLGQSSESGFTNEKQRKKLKAPSSKLMVLNINSTSIKYVLNDNMGGLKL
jgi:hypothetical protein